MGTLWAELSDESVASDLGATTWQHVQFCRQLLPEEKPQRYSIRFSQIIALLVTVLCMALAAYLLVTTGQGETGHG